MKYEAHCLLQNTEVNQSCEYYIPSHIPTEWLYATESKLYTLPFCPSSLRFNGQISYSYNSETDL